MLLLTLTLFTACSAQTDTKTTTQMANDKDSTQTNPLLCDPDSGICEVPGEHHEHVEKTETTSTEKALTVVYFTDPICSSCWGIEPQLKKLKLEYGNAIDIEYHMGGLLKDWSYNSGGISKPSDVAHHWDEVSGYYDMPIDGDVWLEDPLPSSYPPSIAFKAAQIQDEHKARLFLREIREMVFLQKKNITKWEHLATAGSTVGLDTTQLKADMEGAGKTLFEQDLQLSRMSGVRGFPTVFIVDQQGRREMVYGSRPYEMYEQAIQKLAPAVSKSSYDGSFEALFTKYSSLTAREYSELSGTPREKTEALLDGHVESGDLKKLTTKNGAIWTRKN